MVSTSMENLKVEASSFGQTETSMMANGFRESRTAKGVQCVMVGLIMS